MVREGQRVEALTGEDLRRMLQAGARALERHAEAINALNVFPVPDGDTGTNMLLTLRSVLEEVEKVPDASLGRVAEAMARGALLGARGNAGVILSQFLRGMARALDSQKEAPPDRLVRALEEGSRSAYRALANPVEGTILTVLREAAQAAREAVSHPEGAVAVLERACTAAEEALSRTPEQLPVLKEAGVVDAGGQGLVVLLQAFLRTLKGEGIEDIRLLPSAAPLGRVREEFLQAVEEEEYGYCLSFLLEGHALDPDALRERMGKMGTSLVVVGDEQIAKVHLHTPDPQAVLSACTGLGRVTGVQMENIDVQHRQFEALHRRKEAPAVAVLAVVWGKGLEEVFRSLGAEVLPGGQTMNPSCQEILDAVASLGSRTVLLLPNNPNIIPTAEQASSLSSVPIHVVPTRTIPQGLSALLAFSPERGVEENRQAMAEALRAVRTGEVVTAIRDASIGGRKVQEGAVMGFLDGELVAVGTERLDVLVDSVRAASPSSGSSLTLFWGGEVTEGEAQEAGRRLRDALPGVEVEVLCGGQPFYHYIFGVE